DDLWEMRDQLCRFLKEYGIIIQPMADYSFGGRDFVNLIEADMKGADLFVQLLSLVVGIRPPDVPQGYNRLQLEMANANKLPVMQWVSPDLTTDKVTDHEYAAMLNGDTVMKVSFETFKREILERLKRLGTDVTIPPQLVRLVCDKSDSMLAEIVAQELNKSSS